MVADRAGRVVTTQHADVAAHFTLRLAERGYDNVQPLPRTPAEVASFLLRLGVPMEKFAERMLFVESVGADSDSADTRAARVAAMVPRLDGTP